MSVIDPVILNELQRLAKTMDTALSALGAAVVNVDGDVASVTADVGAVSGQVTGVNNAVAAMQATVSAINASGGTKGIKSVQRFETVVANGSLHIDVSIAAVNFAKAEVRNLGWYSSYAYDGARVSLLNATTVRVKRLSSEGVMGASVEVTDWN